MSKSLFKNTVVTSILRVLPWVITIFALYIAFRGIDWVLLFNHIGSANPSYLLSVILLTLCSYCMRARRWQHLFPKPTLSYFKSLKVLLLGFFMNNVLPARAGELVRAHMGAKISGETRTLVLATVANERLADGLTISLLFVAFSFHVGDPTISENLGLVALLFAAASLMVIVTLFFRTKLFEISRSLSNRLARKSTSYALQRFEVFLDGLAPICNPQKFPIILLWSLIVWLIELAVYINIGLAFDYSFSLATAVLFLVAVNFSSLIPAAPGGIGVIEVVASSVLVSVGIPKELALTMVLTQHLIQYLVVCLPGAIIMLGWKNSIQTQQDEQPNTAISRCQ